MNNPSTKLQTFFPGHDDEDDYHYVTKDGTRRCAKCGDPMGAFDKVRIRGGPADKCSHCKGLMPDLLAVETPSGRYCSTDCVVAHAKGEVKTAMTPVGERPSKRTIDANSVRNAEEREKFRADLALKIADHARKVGIPIQSFDMKDAVDAAEQQEIEMLKQKIQQRAEQSEASMVKEIAAKMSQLTPEQVTQARARAVEALEIALFHTDSAVQAHLLMNAKFDDPNEASAEMKRLWDSDANGWRSDAAKRAVKMVEIMDARGKRTLRGP